MSDWAEFRIESKMTSIGRAYSKMTSDNDARSRG